MEIQLSNPFFKKNLSKSGGKLNQNIQLQDLGTIVTGRGNSVSVRVSPDSADGIAKLHELSSTPAIL